MRYLPSIACAAMLMISIVNTSNACAEPQSNNHSQWTQEMLQYKHDFIAEQADMTQQQRDKFMPLYEAMEKEIFAANRTARDMAKKVSNNSRATDQDYANAAKAMSQVKVKEGEIEGRYFEKFSRILSKKQLFLLKQAEIKFRRQMITKGKKR